MTDIVPRFEFRAFAQDLGHVGTKMRHYSDVEQIRESHEAYIISAGTDEFNTKVRGGMLDIKELVKVEQGLEQWIPKIKSGFPIGREMMEKEIMPALNLKLTGGIKKAYSFRELIALVNEQPELILVNLFKRRFAFTINDCIAELADVYINGAYIRTANIESSNAEKLRRAIEMTGLREYENVNYPRAIKRVAGLAELPAGWPYYKELSEI